MSDVWIALAVAVTFMAGIAYEIAGLTIPGWHTISYSAHRSWLVRGTILGSVLALFAILSVHFAGNILK